MARRLPPVNVGDDAFGAGETIVQKTITDPDVIGEVVPFAQLCTAAALDLYLSVYDSIICGLQAAGKYCLFERSEKPTQTGIDYMKAGEHIINVNGKHMVFICGYEVPFLGRIFILPV